MLVHELKPAIYFYAVETDSQNFISAPSILKQKFSKTHPHEYLTTPQALMDEQPNPSRFDDSSIVEHRVHASMRSRSLPRPLYTRFLA